MTAAQSCAVYWPKMYLTVAMLLALAALSGHEGKDEVVFQFGGWKSRMASTVNPDGTTSFLSIDPGVRGFEFNAPAARGVYTRLTLRDPQHTYEFESPGGGGREPASPK